MTHLEKDIVEHLKALNVIDLAIKSNPYSDYIHTLTVLSDNIIYKLIELLDIYGELECEDNYT